MEDKEKNEIRALLKVFGDKLQKPENMWLLNDFSITVNKAIEQSRIDDIYELCVEKIITEQANLFYKDFPISEIKPQLILDFIQMENCRRRNRFNDFCLAMYQQIEAITNYISKDKNVVEVFDRILAYPAYVENGNFRQRIYKKKDETEAAIVAKILFGNDMAEKAKSALPAQYAVDKIKSVVYIISYKCALQYGDYNNFTYMTEKLNEIYQYRNTNHRGSEINEYQQNIFNKIEPIKSKYYFKLMGVLADFVESIEAGYPMSQELKDYVNGLEKKDIKPQIIIVSESNKKIVENIVVGDIVFKRGEEFTVKIEGKKYVFRRNGMDDVNKGDKIEIDGYEIVYGNNISIKDFRKL